MTSKKKLRSLLGGTLFMVLMLSVHPTTVSASAVGSSTVMDQSVETEDQQSGIQSETQTQASQDSGAAVRASQNGWVKAGDSGWYFYSGSRWKPLLFPELGRHSEKCVSQHQRKNVLCTGKWYRCPWNSQNNEWTW